MKKIRPLSKQETDLKKFSDEENQSVFGIIEMRQKKYEVKEDDQLSDESSRISIRKLDQVRESQESDEEDASNRKIIKKDEFW